MIETVRSDEATHRGTNELGVPPCRLDEQQQDPTRWCNHAVECASRHKGAASRDRSVSVRLESQGSVEADRENRDGRVVYVDSEIRSDVADVFTQDPHDRCGSARLWKRRILGSCHAIRTSRRIWHTEP